MAYPGLSILLNLSGRTCLVVGGGAVGVRKAAQLLDAGALRVRLLSPEYPPNLPAGVEHLAGLFTPGHLVGVGLVVAATNDAAVNDAVLQAAGERGVLASRVDPTAGHVPGDFTNLAAGERGPVLVAVSAGSAAMSVATRDRLLAHLGEDWPRLAAFARDLRTRLIHADEPDEATRRAVFRDLATDAALDVLAAGGEDALWCWLTERHPGLLPLQTK
ncbi:MAG: bifunctional precorrin-2 dehydrogenase/sirohydrochlorin ferrochelatase [Phycisphaerae bacterium]